MAMESLGARFRPGTKLSQMPMKSQSSYQMKPVGSGNSLGQPMKPGGPIDLGQPTNPGMGGDSDLGQPNQPTPGVQPLIRPPRMKQPGMGR